MNSFIETLNNFAAGLLPIAWQMFWQSGLLIVVIFAMDFLLRRKIRASVRYTLWLVVLVKLLLPPTLALPTGLAWWLRPGEAPLAAVQAREVVIGYPDNSIPFHRPIIPATFVPPAPYLSVQAWIFIFASAISAALLAWLLTRWIQISRTVRQAGEPGDSIPAVLEEARRIIPINSRVRVRVTKEKMSPAVCGLFRAAILLSESLVNNLPASQLRAVLVHELVHIKRRDVWMNCLQALVQIVYWWHPLVWFANARIRRVREEAVDDAVMLALRDEADCYAPTLLEVAKHAFHRPLASLGLVGILESRGALRQRIERLIDFKMPRRTGLSFVSLLGIAAFTAVAVPMGEAPLRSTSETKAPPATHPGAGTNSSPTGIVTDPQFKTVLNELQQREQLSQLIQDARLLFELGKYDEAERRLSEVLKIDPKSAAANYYLTLVRRSLDKEKVSGAEGIRVNDLVYRTTNQQAHAAKPIQLAQNNSVQAPEPLQAAVPVSPLDGVLVFDNQLKEATVNAGEAEAKFKFNLTNVASFDVTITNILTSCGCTVAKMPASPWLLAPGATGEIPVTMNLAGKSGVLTKTVSVNSDKGTKVLTVKATILPAAGTEPPSILRTSPLRQAIMKKLDQIYLESIYYDSAPLPDVLKSLREEVRRRDPDKRGINFVINPNEGLVRPPAIDPTTGLPAPAAPAEAGDINTTSIKINPPLTNVRVADVLDAIVKSSDKPIKYSILDYGIVFSPLTQADLLRSRRFKVDPRTFLWNLEKSVGASSSDPARTRNMPIITIKNFFKSAGLNLEPPKAIFFNDSEGSLWVRATTEDLDLIEGAIQTLNTAPPQVVIRVKFIEMPTELAEALPIGWTNLPVGAPRVISLLTSPQIRELIPALQNKNGVAELSNGNVTTLSGRQVQFQVVDLPMDAAMKLLNTNHLTLTNTLPTGPTLDVIPYVGDDGYTIHMTLIPTPPEFLGYDDPGKFGTPTQDTNSPLTAVLPLPHFRLRQVTTSVVVWDGQTVVLGGLMPKNDLSSIGKSFSDGQERALLIFVTPTIIDPVGNRVHTDEQLNSLPNINR